MNFLGCADLVRRALDEDRADLDLTTLATIPPEARGIGKIISRVPGVIAGLPVAAAVFAELDPAWSFPLCSPRGPA